MTEKKKTNPLLLIAAVIGVLIVGWLILDTFVAVKGDPPSAEEERLDKFLEDRNNSQ